VDRLRISFIALLLSLAPAVAQQCGTLTTCPSASTPLSGSELLYIVQGGVSSKITAGQIATSLFPLTAITGPAILGNASAGTGPVAALSIGSGVATALAGPAGSGAGFALYSQLGTFAFQNYASPPAIGGTTPAAGSFSALTDTALGTAGLVTNTSGGALGTTPVGSGVLTALQVAANAQNGFPTVFSSSLTTGHCLEWGPGLEDAGSVCGGATPPSYWARSYGVKCDGATNDTAALQALINTIISAGGGLVIFPAGNCLVPGGIVENLSSYSTYTKPFVSFQGQGPMQTFLTSDGLAGAALQIEGGTTNDVAYVDLSDLSILGNDTSGSTGLLTSDTAYLHLRNMTVQGFINSWSASDLEQSVIEHVNFIFNTNGPQLNGAVNATGSNSITFYDSSLSNNASTGGLIKNFASVSFYNGSVQYNGTVGTGGEHGLLFEDTAGGSFCGYNTINIDGTAFEGNGGDYDLEVLSNFCPNAVLNANGVAFMRHPSNYATNNIVMAGTEAGQSLNLSGSTFNYSSGYTPSASHLNVKLTNANAQVYDNGSNRFASATEGPAYPLTQLGNPAAVAGTWSNLTSSTNIISFGPAFSHVGSTTLSSLNQTLGTNEPLEIRASNVYFDLGPINLGFAGVATGSIVVNGVTSGGGTLTGQAAQGTPTWTLPTGSGTLAVSASAPLSLNATTGALTISNIGNGSLSNSSVTIGTTNVALGATATTLAGLTSVTSTTFIGALTGHASLDAPAASPTFTGTVTYPDAGTHAAGGLNGSVIGASTPEPGTFTKLVATGYIVGNSNIGGAYPTQSTGLSIGWNFSGTLGEADFINSLAAATTVFNFYQQTGASAATLLASINSAGSFTPSGAIIMGGSHPTGSTGSCAASSFSGGYLAGKFSAAVCAAGTFILSGLPTAPNGYVCSAQDQTTPADTVRQSANTASSVTFTATTVASDAIVYQCEAF
jgi:hypothetical protein